MTTDTLQPVNEGDDKFSAAKLSEELMDIQNSEKQARDAAWQQYKGYDEAYERANAERVATRQITVEHYPQATLVAQIRLDDSTGEVLSGHDYNPEAKSHKDTEAEFQSYISSTPAEERLMIYEGGDAKFDDRDRAVRDRADAGLAMFLADRAGVERTSGDPTAKVEFEDLISRGVGSEEAALFITLRAIGSGLVKEPDRAIDPGGDIYAQLARIGVQGFREYGEKEKARIGQQPEARDKLLHQMADEGARFALEKFNPVLRELGLPQFEVGADGTLSLPGVNGTQLVESTGPSGSDRLNEIAKMNIEFRDRHLFDTIVDATKGGKKPFVMFGGSHVVALKPALDGYFGQKE